MRLVGHEIYIDLWTQIIKQKISNQSRALSIMGMDGSEVVGRCVNNVTIDNVDIMEALAAKEYFSYYNDIYYQNMLKSQEGYDEYIRHYLAATPESNQNLVNVIENDANVVGLNFIEYQEGMTGGKRVALVVRPEDKENGVSADYHWYVYDEASGYWYNKNGQLYATARQLEIIDGELSYGNYITDYTTAAAALGYEVVGEYYIVRQDGSCFE